jgi:hypothetical protein
MLRQPLAILLSILVACWLCAGESRAAVQEAGDSAPTVVPAEQAAPSFIAAPPGACDPSDGTTFCLASRGRFQVQAYWRSANGSPLTGQALPLTRKAGVLSFFSPEGGDPDIVVKIVDGRRVNGFFWVFIAGLTESAFEISFTDTVTGKVKQYSNEPGQLASVEDLTAFQDPPGAADGPRRPIAPLPAGTDPDFTYLPKEPMVGQHVTFTAETSLSNPIACWDFAFPCGDPSVDPSCQPCSDLASCNDRCTEHNPCHSPCNDHNLIADHKYEIAGRWVVRLKLTSVPETTTFVSHEITVCQLSVAAPVRRYFGWDGTPGSQMSFPVTGADGNLHVTASPEACSWQASSDSPFMTVTPNEETSMVSFHLVANPDKPRQGTLTVAGTSIPWKQDGNACTPCHKTKHNLCLHNAQFEVRLDAHGGDVSGPALAVPVSFSNDTGYFTFSDASTVDLMTKVIDGTASNGNFWFYFAGLTDVPYTITVRDTLTGCVKSYDNETGKIKSEKDSGFFGSSSPCKCAGK